MTLVERAAEWPKQWLQEGIEQGLAHERALLCRQAALRFGAETAARVSSAVDRIAGPEGLAVAGEWIVRACRRAGYEPPVICTPNELMEEYDHGDETAGPNHR